MIYGVSARDLRGAPLGRLRQVHVVDVAVDVDVFFVDDHYVYSFVAGGVTAPL